MLRTIWIIGALSALLAVAAGAFATHGLQQLGDVHGADIVRTGALYGLVHGLVLLVLGVAHSLAVKGMLPFGQKRLLAGAGAVALGAVLFPGSLYLYVATGWRPLVFVTPVGGTAFLIGWVFIGLSVFRARARV
ncbi:DUF423 domain-containing protein [Tistrella bauzanensis]|uniref:DUF423 domain-containing protein n=1 Tax=Tistrella bauzanensis TaxID=657419 RepID=A0ABQ1IBN3_9PROT|nr:DUF423 domain-containing protein [Tistrella bauzanensis]GGB28503.1 DUF423 domain-containing protein [Tistrella bauzanensis]